MRFREILFLLVFTAAAVDFTVYYFKTYTLKPTPWENRLRDGEYTEQEFTEILKDAVSALPRVKNVTIAEALTLKVELDDEFQATCNLDNLYAVLPEKREEQIPEIKKWLTTIDGLAPMIAEGSIENVVPIIKSDRYLAETAQAMPKDQSPPYREHLAADIWVLYAFDSANAMRIATESDIKELHLDKVALRKKALENLKKRINTPTTYGDDTIKMIVCGGDYEASLLLDDERWIAIEKQVKGKLIACVPSRDILYYSGSDDKFENESAADAIRKFSKKISAEGNYLISETILERKDGKWAPYSK